MAQSVSSLCGEIVPCNALYVIARSNATRQSPGRESLL